MTLLRTLCILLTLGLVLGHGDWAHAQTDAPRSGPNPHLFVTGLITTGAAYTPAILVAMNSPRKEDGYLYAPFAGPWLDLANRKPEGDNKFNHTLLVIDGVVQAVGAFELLASFMFVSGGGNASSEPDTFTAYLVPAKMGHGGYGLNAHGKF
jgi:hypothetical protein